MRYFWAGVIAVLAAMSLAAYWMTPRLADDGRTPLVWTTDPNPQRDPQVAMFNKMYPHLQLRIDPDNTDATRVIVQSSAGMGPDLIGRVYEAVIQSYHEAGLLMDLTDYAEDMGFGLDTLPEDIQQFVSLDVLMEDGTIQSRMFAYPANMAQHFIFYNKNVFDRAGVPYPPADMTWEQYIDIAQKLTVMDKERGVPRVFGGGGAIVDTIIYAHDAEYLNESGTRSTMDRPEFIDAMVFLHKLYYEYGVEPTPLQQAGIASQGGWGAGYNNWFSEGRLGMIWGERWRMISFRRAITEQKRAREIWFAQNPDADPDDAPEILRIGATQIPRMPDRPRYTTAHARSVAINDANPHRKEALYFLQYLASEPYARLINEGSDSKPPNIQFHELDLFINPEWPGEEEVHAASLEAVQYGRTRRRSMLVTNATINHIFQQVRSRIIASPDMTRDMIAAELERAADRVNLHIARNIKRNPRVQTVYETLLAQGAEPIVYDLEEIE